MWGNNLTDLNIVNEQWKGTNDSFKYEFRQAFSDYSSYLDI